MTAYIRSRSAAAVAAAIGLVTFSLPNVGLAQPCPGQGNAALSITSSESLVPGRRISLELLGSPNLPVVVAADVGPGPVVRPHFGTICLDLGPRHVLLFDGIRRRLPSTDAEGRFAFNLDLPAKAVLGGRTFYLQAMIKDPAAPNGFALSPRVDLELGRAIVENFKSIAQRDAAATTARWTGDGLLYASASAPRFVEIEPTDSGFNLADPLDADGGRIQLLFRPEQIGASPGESIIGAAWGPRSNFVSEANHAGVTMLLGHAAPGPDGLSIIFQSNYDGTPTQVFSGDYSIPGSINAEWYPWPEFTTDFQYDAARDLVFEANVPPGFAEHQLFRANSTASVPRTRVVGEASAPIASFGEHTIYHHRFTLARVRSVAQSLFQDTGLEDPDYDAAIVSVVTSPPGSEMVVEFEGAEDADADGVPDPGTLTGFRSDPNEIDGSRLVRFRISFRTDPTGFSVSTLRFLSIPYR